MKHFNNLRLLVILAIAGIFSGCSGSGSSGQEPQVDLIPARYGSVAVDQKLEDALKNLLSENKFTGMTPCVNNYAALSSTDLSREVKTLYKFDGTNFVKVGDTNYLKVGYLNEGRIPVRDLDGNLSVLDADLKEIFNASEVDGVKVASLSCVYSEGLLGFILKDNRSGCFDRDGKVAFIIETTEISPSFRGIYFTDGFIDLYYQGGYATFNRKGELMHQFSEKITRNGDSLYKYEKDGDAFVKIQYAPDGKELSRTPDSGVGVLSDEEAMQSAIISAKPFDITALANKYKGQREAMSVIQSANLKFKI